MPFSRARYVTLCQQSLVTATVLVVGISAAGIKTLEIVPAPAPLTDAHQMGPEVVPGTTLSPARTPGSDVAPQPESKVDAAPVTPKVREVSIAQEGKAATPQSTQGERVAPKREIIGGKPLVALSAPQKVTGYATVGVTWQHGVQLAEGDVALQVRTERAGSWSEWTKLDYHDDHGPDADAADAGELTPRSRPGTDALVVGDVDRVQVRAENSTGRAIPDMRLAVIDPGTGKMVEQQAAIDTASLASARTSGTGSATGDGHAVTSDDGTSDDIALSAMKVAPKPQIYSRAQWGANEKLRDQTPPDYGTVKAGFIHHTVNANNYTADQVPALLRGIYAYHTQSRGWRDIGYNFLVDRFGRIWEGRYGGVDKAVVGAHTQGYNEVSFAMSAIGNFETAQPPAAIVDAFARLFAWKLSLYNIRADQTRVWLKNRYVNAINGHRDVGQTACPGKYLYAKIPTIRALAQSYQNAAQTGAPAPAPTPADPNTLVSPTQAPTAAVAQPGIARPRSLNLLGDAAPDLVLRSPDGTVSILQTGGQVGFRAPVTTGGGWRSSSLVVAVGDVTGDARGDLLVRNTQGVSGILAGDGAGHVSGPLLGLTPRFKRANLVMAAGDWNRDGRADVIMRDGRGRLWLVKGKGAGRFGGVKLLSTNVRDFTSMTVAGDLTGDVRPDVVGLRRDHQLYLGLRKKGKLKLVPRQRLSPSITQIMGGTRDLTGDQYGDLVIRAGSGPLQVLPGKRHGWFGRALGPFDETASVGRLSLAPMTGSAAPDLVGIRGTALAVVAHNGLTNLRSVVRTNLRSTDISQVINAGDWNGDGRGDLITRQGRGNTLMLWLGSGIGQFTSGGALGSGWSAVSRLAAVGDVTGDGLPDLMGTGAGGRTVIFPGYGAKGLKRPVLAADAMRTFNLIGTGTWRAQELATASFLGANASFVPFVGTGAGAIGGYNWVFGPGDVDGDGRADLVARDGAGALWLLPGTVSGYAARRLIGEGFAGYSLGG